jgi:Ca-activated chloride channel family protein
VSFQWPFALLLLLVVPAIAGVYLMIDHGRRSQIERFGNPALLTGMLPARPNARRHLPIAILLAGLAALIFGVARPHAKLSVPREEATIMLALDTSLSMSATDVKPSRLKAAISSINAFIDRTPSKYRVGIVSFSDRAQLILPPTADREAAHAALREIRLGRGTAIGGAIARSLAAVRPKGKQAGDAIPATIVLLSDGAQTGGGPPPAAAAAASAKAGVPVSTVALGTGDAVVEVPIGGGLKERVVVAPDLKGLSATAKAGAGTFYEAADAVRLEKVYRELGSRIGHHREDREVTAAFAGLGGVLALAASVLSMLWYRRPM